MLPGQKLVNGHISVEPLPPLWLLYVRERGARSPARFAPPWGRGGNRSVPRGCPEPAAPLGPAGGAGSAHPLRTRRLGKGARRGAGPPTCRARQPKIAFLQMCRILIDTFYIADPRELQRTKRLFMDAASG